MTRAILAAAAVAGLVLPSMADNVTINSGGNDIEINNYYYDDDGEERRDDESWYEEAGCSGPVHTRIEWQWHFHGGRRVLRCRRANYHTVTSAWIFTPWEVKVHICLPGCSIHHVHRFHHGCAPVRRHLHKRPKKHCGYYRSEPTRVYEYHSAPRYEYHSAPRHEYPSAPRPSTVQPPVRRPPVRQVPGAYRTNLQVESRPASLAKSSAPQHEPIRIVRKSEPQRVSSTAHAPVRVTSGR